MGSLGRGFGSSPASSSPWRSLNWCLPSFCQSPAKISLGAAQASRVELRAGWGRWESLAPFFIARMAMPALPGSPWLSLPFPAPYLCFHTSSSHPQHFQSLPRLQWIPKPLDWSESPMARWYWLKWVFYPGQPSDIPLELPPCPFISRVSAHRAQVCCLAVGCFGKQCAVNITFYCLWVEQWLNSGSGVEGSIQREDSHSSVPALVWVFATQKPAQLQGFLSSFPCFAPCIYIGASSLRPSLI